MPTLIEESETQRLEALLPSELRSRVTIVRSTAVAPTLIATESAGKKRFSIQIDFVRWGQFSVSQRDLLFWHEVTRIQNRTIAQFPWELTVMLTGLVFSSIEIASQNLWSLSVALVVTGLAAYQLYQQNRGERSLRAATSADRGAIELATQFGYSFSQAHRSLYEAIKMLAKQPSQPALWKKYQVRLRVLEILIAKQRTSPQQVASEFGVAQAPKEAVRFPLKPLAYRPRSVSKLL